MNSELMNLRGLHGRISGTLRVDCADCTLEFLGLSASTARSNNRGVEKVAPAARGGLDS
jgi:hypothetical protein